MLAVLDRGWLCAELGLGGLGGREGLGMKQAAIMYKMRAISNNVPVPLRGAGWEDDYIDDTMDAENYESSFDEWGAS